MAKKQNPQILSPENYIRQRARNLPLYECLLNDDWQEKGLANILIARRHINGNITLCSYLVDLGCLGIKDSFFKFNIFEYEYEEIKEIFVSELEVTKVEYSLVHNIIYAAWEYAENIGFKPVKDFLSITQYMLEEDTDDIPIIDIHCGDKKGKPVYVRGMYDTEAQAMKIVNHLEKTLGEGNYTFILSLDEVFDDEEDDDNKNEYFNNSLEENMALFLKEANEMQLSLPEEYDEKIWDSLEKLFLITDAIYPQIVDEAEVDEWIDKWEEEVESLTFSEVYHNAELLGLDESQDLTEVDLEMLEDAETPKEEMKYISNRWGEIPYLIYLRINNKTFRKPSQKKLKILLSQYPDYSLFKIQHHMMQIPQKKTEDECLDYRVIFKNRTEVTYAEYQLFNNLKIMYFLSVNHLAGIESLYLFFLSLENDREYGELTALFALSRIVALKEYLLKNKENNK